MNKQEQETAKALLEKIKSSKADEVGQFSTAYQALTQGAVNRAIAEKASE